MESNIVGGSLIFVLLEKPGCLVKKNQNYAFENLIKQNILLKLCNITTTMESSNDYSAQPLKILKIKLSFCVSLVFLDFINNSLIRTFHRI